MLYGFSAGLVVEAALGLDPWNVLHQGLAGRTALTIGLWTVVMSFVVLLLWVPLRQRPGLGTLANAVVVGLVIDATTVVVPDVETLAVRVPLLLAGVVLNGLATAAYIGAGLGPGPRDGLMTGLARRTGRSVRLVRTGIEATVLVIGFLLGGTVGVGTVLYALGIGPLAQLFLPLVDLDHRAAGAPARAARRSRRRARPFRRRGSRPRAPRPRRRGRRPRAAR